MHIHNRIMAYTSTTRTASSALRRPRGSFYTPHRAPSGVGFPPSWGVSAVFRARVCGGRMLCVLFVCVGRPFVRNSSSRIIGGLKCCVRICLLHVVLVKLDASRIYSLMKCGSSCYCISQMNPWCSVEVLHASELMHRCTQNLNDNGHRVCHCASVHRYVFCCIATVGLMCAYVLIRFPSLARFPSGSILSVQWRGAQCMQEHRSACHRAFMLVVAFATVSYAICVLLRMCAIKGHEWCMLSLDHRISCCICMCFLVRAGSARAIAGGCRIAHRADSGTPCLCECRPAACIAACNPACICASDCSHTCL
jgi:hypothetical protein